MKLSEKIFGTHSSRELKRIMPLVDKIEELRPTMQAMTDEELKDQTRKFKERLAEGETLDDLLPEAFATVREASKRVLNMEHYRVQLIGGIILHQGRIAEMRTGEGKTLVSTCPAYLNALEGKGVHIVTVNDYLAKRDAEWMGKVHEFLGLKVGVILNSMKNDERREQYACDITYVTNNEDGFDYLRDNMVIYKEQLVQRELHYAIIDEVDSVLIDEARTPLIISGQSGKSTKLYEVCDILARQLQRGEASGEMTKMTAIMGEEIIETGDFIVNEKDKVVNLTEEGVTKAAVETVAENASDGVIAPLFYLAIGGPLLGWLYKAVNTMDSMVGYKNDRYLHFGRAAAKLDDLVNLIPSRLAALLLIVSAYLLRYDGKNAYRIWRRDRRNHKSPNSAQTESACAGALGLRLAGDAWYFGKLVPKPYIGDEIHPIEPQDIRRVNRLMYGAAGIMGLLALGMRAVILF